MPQVFNDNTGNRVIVRHKGPAGKDAHLTALGAGATGKSLFAAANVAAAQEVLSLTQLLANLSSNFSTTSDTLVDVTTMPPLPLKANKIYVIELHGNFQSAAAGTGAGFALNVGGTVTSVTGRVWHASTGTGTGTPTISSQEVNNATVMFTTGVRAADTPTHLLGTWFVVMGATGGDAQLKLRTESAGITVRLNSPMLMRAFEY